MIITHSDLKTPRDSDKELGGQLYHGETEVLVLHDNLLRREKNSRLVLRGKGQKKLAGAQKRKEGKSKPATPSFYSDCKGPVPGNTWVAGCKR